MKGRNGDAYDHNSPHTYVKIFENKYKSLKSIKLKKKIHSKY